LLAASAAYADAACSASSTSLECRLKGVLHWLDAAALVLALALIIAIGFVVHLFRKNRPNRKAGR
jgi:hypothetical protein